MFIENQTPETFESGQKFVRASVGKRFINYVVDVILMYGIYFVSIFIITYANPSIANWFDDDGSTKFSLVDKILSLALYASYMGCQETLFDGRSFGKFVTRTRAVNLDGTPISTKTAFLRGLCRAVPFAALSALGHPSNPWQDKWTDTMVVIDAS